MILLRCYTQYVSKFGKQKWPQDWKRSVSIPVPKKGNDKECSDYCTIPLISHASKVMPKILKARLQQYMKQELTDVQAGFGKGRGTRNQIANICWIIEKAREFKKKSASLTTLKHLTVWITTNGGKFFKRWKYQTTLSSSWETSMQDKNNRMDMEQQTGSKSGKESFEAIYCHPAYLTYMQSACEMPSWMNHKLESRLPGEISTTSDMQIIPL